MPKSKRIMIFFTCLMMAGGVFYWLKNETDPAPSLLWVSEGSEALFAAEKTAADPQAPVRAKEPGETSDAQETPDGADPIWILATEPLMVNINTADGTELEKLPGIGPAKAAAIIAYRQAHGAFSCVEDLMKVPGIKEATFAKLAAYVTV